MKIQYYKMETPLGPLVAYLKDGALVGLEFEDRCEDARLRLERRFGPVRLIETEGAAQVVSRIESYFTGDITALDAIAVDPAGTPFQRDVWAALRKIPPGTTTTYAEIARSIGHPRAYRAVGSANAMNPIAVVVPCHRVIGTDRKLHGYAGGLARKQWLLDHEMRERGRRRSGYDHGVTRGNKNAVRDDNAAGRAAFSRHHRRGKPA